VPPTAALAQPSYNVVDELDTAGNWVLGGTATSGAGANPDTVTRVNVGTRTITSILFDTGVTGWACVQPNSMADIGRGMRLTIGGTAETVTVQETYPGGAATTIAGVTYEVGASGLGWIHLTIPLALVEPNSMLVIDAAGANEKVRVLAVESTPDGYTSIRCATLTAFVGGETVQVLPSFRAYFVNAHAAADTLAATSLGFAVATGTGYMTRNVGAATPLDLSLIAAGVPTRGDDRVHLSSHHQRGCGWRFHPQLPPPHDPAERLHPGYPRHPNGSSQPAGALPAAAHRRAPVPRGSGE
jgi:hypothetical protein